MMHESGLILPDPVDIGFGVGQLTDWGREQWHLAQWEHGLRRQGGADRPPIAGGAGTFANWFQQQVLNHGTGEDNASWANLQPTYLALCTATVAATNTGSTITEANYTGYARQSVPNTSWGAASSSGGSSTITTTAAIVFAGCTGGSSVITFWALCTSSGTGTGNVVAWGSCTSTTISTTQTPAQVASAGLTIQLT